MAIVIREDNGIKKVGKTFADGSFIEIKAVLDSNGDVDETLSETKLDNTKIENNKTETEKQVTVDVALDTSETEEI
tara:strand:+ start:700 stop:927 length:228 start_codon:yes stop_codon:yes gene_type:complete